MVEVAPIWTWEAVRNMTVPLPCYSDYPDGIHIPSLEDVGGVICGSV